MAMMAITTSSSMSVKKFRSTLLPSIIATKLPSAVSSKSNSGLRILKLEGFAHTQVFGGGANTSGGIIEQPKGFLLPSLGRIPGDIRVAPEGQRHGRRVARSTEY